MPKSLATLIAFTPPMIEIDAPASLILLALLCHTLRR